MNDLIRTVIIQSLADLTCLSVILYLERQPVKIIAGYYITKVVVFAAYRFRRPE